MVGCFIYIVRVLMVVRLTKIILQAAKLIYSVARHIHNRS